MATKPKQTSGDDWIQIPDWNQRGISERQSVLGDFDKASEYIDPSILEMQQLGFDRISLSQVVPGGTYEFGSGTVTAPGIRWAADTDSGLYLIAAGNIGASINGDLKFDWNASRLRLDASYSLQIADLTPTRVVFVGASEELADDAGLIYTAASDRLDIAGQLRVGTATDTATAGDFAAGLLNASRIFFDQSLQTFSLYDSSNNEDISLDAAGNSWYNGAGNFAFGSAAPVRKVDIIDSTAAQLRIGTSASFYADFEHDGTDLYIKLTAGTGEDVIHQGATAGFTYRMRVNNTDNTDLNSSAAMYCQVGGTSAGDPHMVFSILGGSTWIAGADNSDSDKLKITTSALSGFSGTKGIFVTSGIYSTFAPAVAASGTDYGVDITGAINTGGTNGLLRVLAAASTGQTASTEIKFLDLDLGATTTWATGALANQRSIFIEAPTLAFVGASTVTNAATVYIDRAPQAGTNATLTNSYAFWIGGGRHILADGTLTVASAAGATWNSVLLDMDVSLSGVTDVTTATGFNMVVINAPTITDAGTITSVTNSATVYISGAPTGSGLTITNAYALWVDDGAVRFDGAVTGASFTVSGLTDTRVVFAGAGGALTDDAGLTYDAAADALTIGVGINIIRTAALGETVFNETGLDLNLRIEGDTDANLLFCDASTDRVGIGTTGPDAKLDVLSTSTQLRLTYTDGTVYTDFLTDSGGNTIVSNSGNSYIYRQSKVGANLLMYVYNQDNTNGASHAFLAAVSGGTSGGDAGVIYEVAGGQQWITGVDNSDGDKWKLCIGADLNAFPVMIVDGSINVVFNETGLDADHRIESDDESYCLMVEGTLNNIVLCANAEPGFNSLDGGVFLSEANVVPTGNPTAGIYIYVEGGAGKARGTGGTITTWAPAEPHCEVCGTDYGHEWENSRWGRLQFCVNCLADDVAKRNGGELPKWIKREAVA